MAGATAGKQSSPAAPSLPVPSHERRTVTFKNTPDIHIMTPQNATPVMGGEGVWADANPYASRGASQSGALPAAGAVSPSRSRIAGPYAFLSPTDAPSSSANGATQPTSAVPKPSWYQRLKNAAKALKQEVLAVYYAMQHPQTPFLAKAIAFLVLAYALSPLDLVPDFIPVLGILDDLILLPLMIAAAIALLPRGVMEESRRRASQEPLRLARNWPMAVLIAALWVAALEWSAYFLVTRYGTPFMRQYLVYGMVGMGAACGLGFGVWLAGRVRKEARKRRKAEARAAGPLAGAARGAVGGEEGDVEAGGGGGAGGRRSGEAAGAAAGPTVVGPKGDGQDLRQPLLGG